MPFRNYLMEFVVPTLNEGLLEVSNIIPNDPVDLLAEYLYQKSYDFWKILIDQFIPKVFTKLEFESFILYFSFFDRASIS